MLHSHFLQVWFLFSKLNGNFRPWLRQDYLYISSSMMNFVQTSPTSESILRNPLVITGDDDVVIGTMTI